MKLWIRSQDKRIFKKIEYLEVDEFDGIIIDDECNHLGTYKNQERALEVLDEIQHKLITLCDSMNRHLYVYEMPKE